MSFISTNPATGKIISRCKEHTVKETELKLASAQQAQTAWKTVPLQTRTRLAMKLAALLRKQKHELGMLATLEMGKPIRAAIAEVEKCAWSTEYFAENAERFLSPETVKTDASESMVVFEPLGIILGIMPWNFPFWQVLRYAAPALLAGNATLLKHASMVSGCSLRIEKLFRDAGFPKDLFQSLLIGTDTIPALLSDTRVSAVTLTGSERAGSAVAGSAGKAIKKCVLELGGSDPFIVLADADLEKAAHTGARARLQNAGQSCIAAKRFIVVRKNVETFCALLKARFEEMRIGDGADETTDVGPLASEKMLLELDRQVA
jgi:succinate-semialdehyde dehydrogenase/glutarate-semialdehyde dehydrogenase